MNFKFLLGSIFTIPILPILYYQGKKIRLSVPDLPDAKGTEGLTENHSNRTLRMLVIGESTMAGVGVTTHKEGFAGTLAEEMGSKLNVNISWKVYAESGYTTQKVNEEIIPIISDHSADLIVIGLGGNDAFTLNTPGKWIKNVRELIFELQSKFGSTPIVFANMPPIKLFPAFTPLIKFTIGNLVEILGETLNEIIPDYQKVYYSSQKITIENWMEKFKIIGEPVDFFSDGVHPSKLTYQIWAKDLANFIVENTIFSK